MNQSTYQAKILSVLAEVGQQGAIAKKLQLGTKNSPKRQALRALMASQKVGNLGSVSRPRYVLIVFFKPQDYACEQLERIALEKLQGQEKLRPVNQKSLIEKLPVGSIRGSGRAAADQLVAEGLMLRLYIGMGVYLLPVSLCVPLFSPVPTTTIAVTLTALLEAYATVKKRTGFSNIEIYALQQELGCDLTVLHALLLSLNKEEKIVLTTGDWSLSSENIRQAGIDLAGQKRLLVRFKVQQ